MQALLLTTLLMGQTAQGPDLAQTVTYETVAVPASRALAELSKLTKVELLTSPQTANDVLVFRVTAAPLGELMNRIAAADSAEWTKTTAGYRLVPNVAARNSEVAAEQAQRLSDLRKSIKDWTINLGRIAKATADEIAKRNKDGGTTTSPAEEEILSQSGNGVTRAVVQLLSTLDLNQIAALGPNERLVFSTNPTRTQRPFGGSPGPVFERLVASNNAQVARMPARDPSQEPAGLPPEVMEVMMPTPKKIDAPPALGLLIAEREQGTGVIFSIELYAADGKGVLSEQSYDITGREFPADVATAAPPNGGAQPPEAKPGPTGTKIEFSPLTQELIVHEIDRQQGGGGPKLSDDLVAKLKLPDVYDPLSFSASERLLKTAQNRKLNLVAALPDRFEPESDSQPATIEKTMDLLARGDVCKGVPDGDWLVVKSATPAQDRLDRLDRRSLAKLIADGLAHGISSLDDVAGFSLRNDDDAAERGLQAEQAIVPTGSSPFNEMNGQDWDMIRLYGTLSQVQRVAAQSQNGLPLASFGDDEKTFARRMLFGIRHRLKREVEEGAKKPDPILELVMVSNQGHLNHEYLLEPTESMPDGLPADGYLTMGVENSFFMIPALTGDEEKNFRQGGSFDSVGPIELAFLKVMADHPNAGDPGQQIPKIERGKFGKATNLKFVFHVAPKIVSERLLADLSIDRNAQVKPLDSLSDEQKAEIQKWIAALKSSPMFALIDQMAAIGRKSIPPP